MDKTLAESRRELTRLSTEYAHLIIRKSDGNWLDFVSNGLRPVSIGQTSLYEVLMFRVLIDERDQLSIEIHWDSAHMELISPGDNAKLRGFIETYYPSFDENEQELIRKQTNELERIEWAIPVVNYWMKVICCEIGVRIAERIHVEEAAKQLDQKRLIEYNKMKTAEADLYRKKALRVLQRNLQITMEQFNRMKGSEKLSVKTNIHQILSQEASEIKGNAKIFMGSLNCGQEHLKGKETHLVLGMIRRDFDEVFGRLPIWKPSNGANIRTDFCRRVLLNISETLAKIAHHHDGHEQCVRKELARLVRSVIQYIFRMHHDA
jgi:hypothetical protein